MNGERSPIYAGFVSRATAFVVDAVVIDLVGLIVGVVVGLVLDVLIPGGLSGDVGTILAGLAWWALLNVAYFTGFWALAGQTPGMRLMRLVVVPVGAGRLGWRRAIRRMFGLVTCVLSLGLGFALVLVDNRRQGLLDKIAGTVVLYAPED